MASASWNANFDWRILAGLGIQPGEPSKTKHLHPILHQKSIEKVGTHCAHIRVITLCMGSQLIYWGENGRLVILLTASPPVRLHREPEARRLRNLSPYLRGICERQLLEEIDSLPRECCIAAIAVRALS